MQRSSKRWGSEMAGKADRTSTYAGTRTCMQREKQSYTNEEKRMWLSIAEPQDETESRWLGKHDFIGSCSVPWKVMLHPNMEVLIESWNICILL